MHISELIHLLKKLGTQPKKGLSQNFLINTNVVHKIMQLADVQPGDFILEIGPGPGALTSAMLTLGASVFAIEKDQIFANALCRLQTPDQRLTVYNADALEFPFEQIPFTKVVANLPYHITTPLLEKCFNHPFLSLTLMVQKELKDRLFSQSGCKEYGSLTLFAEFHATQTGSFPVSANCFYPKPSVDSSVIRLDSRPPPDIDKEFFFKWMRRSFQQRRKMLSSSLQEYASSQQIKKALLSAGLRDDARPETLSLNEWLLFLKKAYPCMVQENAYSCPNHQAAF